MSKRLDGRWTEGGGGRGVGGGGGGREMNERVKRFQSDHVGDGTWTITTWSAQWTADSMLLTGWEIWHGWEYGTKRNCFV